MKRAALLLFFALLMTLCGQANAASRFWVPLVITNAISGTGSLCRLTVNDTVNLTSGITVVVSGIVGATACNGTTTVTTVVSSTLVEVNLAFGSGYSSGGKVFGGIWTATGTGNWASSSGGAGGQSVPGASDSPSLDANSGATASIVTVNTTINIGNLTIDNYVGTLDFSANNNNITMNAFSNQGSAVRTLNMGNGTWTITGTGNNWSMVTTNLTFNSNSSTLLFNNNTGATSRTVNCGSANLTYNAVTVQGASPLQFNCALTIGTLTLVGITDVYLSSTGYVVNHFATTTTGSSSATLRALSATSSPPSISTPNASIVNWMAFFNITVTGAGSLTAKNSFDMGKNTGISFTAAAGGATACILGGWLLWRDLTPEEHDNFPAYLDKAA